MTRIPVVSWSVPKLVTRGTNCAQACSVISSSASARRSVPRQFRSPAWCERATAPKRLGSPPTAVGSPDARSGSANRCDGTGDFEGVQVGELVATEGAIFLSNMVTIAGVQ